MLYQLTTTTYREQRDSARTERDAARRDAVAAEKDATESRCEVHRLNKELERVNQTNGLNLFAAIRNASLVNDAQNQIRALKEDCRVLLQENRMQAASIRVLEEDTVEPCFVAAGPIKAGDFVSVLNHFNFKGAT